MSVDTNAARAVHSTGPRRNIVVSAKKEAANRCLFPLSPIHLSKLPHNQPNNQPNNQSPTHRSASSHTHHLVGIRSVPVGQSCNPTGVIGFGLIHWSFVRLLLPFYSSAPPVPVFLDPPFTPLSFAPGFRIEKLDPPIRAEQRTCNPHSGSGRVEDSAEMNPRTFGNAAGHAILLIFVVRL